MSIFSLTLEYYKIHIIIFSLFLGALLEVYVDKLEKKKNEN